ncbi:MAG: ribonuclease P protein component [bacterium]|nr:ribonuclease P protein component [bacterium]
MRHPYPRSARLTSARDFRRLFQSGRRLQSGPLRLVWLTKGVEGLRYTTVAGRKVGKAVVRNRVRRRLRELFRVNRHLFVAPAYLALVVGPGAGELPGSELRRMALELWDQAGLLEGEDGP